MLLVKDGFDKEDELTQAVLDFHKDDEGKATLTELGMAEGFEAMSEEDAEFMIDLMETLQ